MKTFAEHGVSAPVVEALERRGFTSPFKIQNLVLPDALAGKDVLARSRTGSGKTLAFGIPIIERIEPGAKPPMALILVPTRELAVQVTEEIRTAAQARDLRVAAVFGGVPLVRQAEKAAKAHIVVATPGRLTDLVNRRMISLKNISILILDEADRMLDMGFQPQVDRIVDHLTPDRQTMFFSATLDGHVGHLARAYTRDAILYEVEEDKPTVDEADHRFIPVDEHHKLDKLIDVLGEDRGLALIFVRTKRGADRLANKLAGRKIIAGALHGDMTQALRQTTLDRFAAGKIDVLVATDVAARGLDLEGITHVINYDPPQDHKDYLHRVGRTARAGRAGSGVTFVAPLQNRDVSNIAKELKLGGEFEAQGLTLAAPTTVFSSKGRRSSMKARKKRAF